MRLLVVRDVIQAVRLWPIWLRLGLQDVRLRFRRSVLGVGWIFINLAVMLLAIGVVYGKLLGQDIAGFLPFLTVGVVAWGYLTSSILEGGNAFIVSEGYIKQIGLPVYVYVFRFFVSASLTMLLSSFAYIVVAVVYGVEFHWGTFWAVPGMLLLGTVSLLLIVIFAHLNAHFRDTVHLAGAALQVLFYVTPVLWPPEMLRDRGLPWLVDYNPFYHLLEVVRQPLLHAQPATLRNYQAVGILIGGLVTVAATFTWRYYRRLVYFL
jgi:ABC-type polysaccharide/polyol phosphate export permease